MPQWLWIALALIAGYFVFYYVKPFGKALAFVCELLGTPLLALEAKSEEAYARCSEKYQAQPPHEQREFLSHLLYFLLAVSFLLAEVFNTYLAIPALMGTPPVTAPAGWFEYASAILIFTVPAFFGIELLVAVGLVKKDEGLFENPTFKQRIGLALYSLTFFLISVFVIYLFWRFRALYLSKSPDPMVLSNMALQVIEGLGFLVVGAALLLFRAIQVGIQPVIKLSLGLLCLALQGIAFIVQVIIDTLDFLSRHFAGKSIRAGSASQSEPASGSIPAEESQKSEEFKMPTNVVAVGFIGPESTRMITPLREQIDRLGAGTCIRASFTLDLTNAKAKLLGYGKDMSVATPSRHAMLSNLQLGQEPYALLLEGIENNLVEEFTPIKAIPSASLFYWDCHTPVASLDGLTRIKNRLGPLHTIALCINVSQHEQAFPSVQNFLQKLEKLQADGVIAVVFELDPAMGFAKEYGREKLDDFDAQSIIALMVAGYQTDNNPSFMEILQKMGRVSPFHTMSFATGDIASGKSPARAFWLHWFSKKGVTGDLSDMLAVSKEITLEAVNNANARAFNAPLSKDRSFTLINMLPLRVDDERFEQGVQALQRDQRKAFPQADTISVSANGLRLDDRIPSVFREGVTILYPLTLTSPLPTSQPTNTSVSGSTPDLKSLQSLEQEELPPSSEQKNGRERAPRKPRSAKRGET